METGRHVNRSPMGGVIRGAKYQEGKFLNAMSEACADLNEQNTVTVEGEGHTIVFKQIAGLLARRVVFTKKVGDAVGRGERIGLMKFSSRMLWAALWQGFRVPPFAADDIIRQARRYKSKRELTRAIRLVGKADLALRSNPPSKRLVLEKLVLDLTAEAKPEPEWMQEELGV